MFGITCKHSPRLTPSAHDSDCTYENIMLDPSGMFPDSFHPADPRKSKDFRQTAKVYSRTRRPTRYHLIDFGLSRLYDPAKGPPLDRPLRGGDKSAPEHQDRETPCNPFPTDVYYLGNLVREEYMEVRSFFFKNLQNTLCDFFRTRNTMASNLCNHSSPIWSKRTPPSAPTWMRSSLVLLRSERGSVFGHFVRGSHATLSSGPLRHGGPSPIGTVP